jgi:tetratricopeptide (TPR) repeat protein
LALKKSQQGAQAMAVEFTDAIKVFYCYAHEDQAMRDELERHYAGEARVIPVILRPVDWDDAPFSKLQVLPTNRRPITSWPNSDEAFFDVARGIRIAVKGYVSQKLRKQSQNKNDIHAEIIHGKNSPRSFELEHHRGGLEVYEEAIRLDPSNVEAHIGKGNALYYLKNYTSASGAYHQAILLDPGNVEIYNFRGQALYTGGYYERAFEVFEQALQVDPKNVKAHNGIASILSALERFAEAIVICDQAINLDPSNALAIAYNNRGLVLEGMGKSKEARQAYKKARQLDYGH